MDDAIKRFRERREARLDAKWEEELHPRDKTGKFTSGSGSAVAVEGENQPHEEPKHESDVVSFEMKRQGVNPMGWNKAFAKGAARDKLDAFKSEFEKMDVEENVSNLVANIGPIMRSGKEPYDSLTIRKSNGNDHITYSFVPNTGRLVKATLAVPEMNKIPEQYRKSQAGIFAHELVHYLNLCHHEGNNLKMTQTDKELGDALRDAKGRITQSVKDKLSAISQKADENKARINKERDSELEKIEEKWQKVAEDSGYKNRIEMPAKEYNKYVDEYNKVVDKYRDIKEWESDSLYGGAAAYSNMYDAISDGEMYEKECFYGHGKAYFQKHDHQKADEALSIFVQMHMAEDKRWIEDFHKEQPRLYNALMDTVKRLGSKR